MSWLFKSLQSNDPDSSSSSSSTSSSSPQPDDRGGGVKDDLTVISETIGRQLRGVANFLAPPPKSQLPPSDSPASSSSPQGLLGIRNDLAEIGGSFNKAVTEISKFTTGFLQFQQDSNKNYDDDDDDDVAGVTDEIINFVKEISTRPECWTDFPLKLQNDFRMSEAQREHALSVDRIVPSLTVLRAELSSYMGDGQFWMIYFILLLPRLSERDFEILSTPQLVEIRNVLLEKLHNKRNVKVGSSENSNALDESQQSHEVDKTQMENIPSREMDVNEIVNATKTLEIDNEESSERWLDETDIETGTSVDDQRKHEHEEDVSFSDLEDDDNDLSTRLSTLRQAQGNRAPSPSGSSDWINLNESSETQGGPHKARQSICRDKDSDVESSDWTKVGDSD